MDVPQILLNRLLSLWWLFPLAILISAFKVPFVKGWLGELMVRLRFKWSLDKSIYHQLHNITLPTPDGTTQIDHIVVSRFGIFIVETKNMKGWIFGSEDQPQWTQKIYRATAKFQNPLRQNFKHVKAVESALTLPIETIHSLVIFVGSATLKTAMPDNVRHAGGGIRFIRSFTTPVFSDDQVVQMIDVLQTQRLAQTYATHQDHVQRLQQRLDESAHRLCPRCGSALIIRVTKSGPNMGEKFWGCTGYPKCRAVQKLG
ncbi:MAG: NERD domain-containing protein [Pseudomonadota bacterium]